MKSQVQTSSWDWAGRSTQLLALAPGFGPSFHGQSRVGFGSFMLSPCVYENAIPSEVDLIHDGPYDRIKNWNYAWLMAVFNSGEDSARPARRDRGRVRRRDGRALAHDGPCLIEVPIDPYDCSEDLREWGSRVAANGRAPRTGPLLQEV
jgi:hypothetical protein